MRAVDLIRRKRDGAPLEPDAIRAFVDGSWPDYQVAAMLMAIVWRGMTLDETAALTDAMVRSGVRLDLSEFEPRVVDKHSTGGVGDNTSLIVAPLAAACGAVVPMMSGRGLGDTGGTLDKLESIPGFRSHLAPDDIRRMLRRHGCALFGQTDEIAPSDRRLYAMRDVTATVESVPLITASIMSKKIAEGIGGLVLDVKAGRGAFMKTDEDARRLASWLIRVGESQGVRTEALVTSMDAPLGRAVGNANEVIEAIETMKGRGPSDLADLSIQLAVRMVMLAGLETSEPAADRRVRTALTSGAALERFAAIVEDQGGDARVIEDYGRLPMPAVRNLWMAPQAGFVTAIDAGRVGRAAVVLGAGRDRADVSIDPAAGIDIVAQIGDVVRVGDPIFSYGAATQGHLDAARAWLDDAVEIGERAASVRPLVLGSVDAAVAAHV